MAALLGTGAAPRKPLLCKQVATRKGPQKKELHEQEVTWTHYIIRVGRGGKRLELGAWMCKEEDGRLFIFKLTIPRRQ